MKTFFVAALVNVLIAGLAPGQNQPTSNPAAMTIEAFVAQAKATTTGSERTALAALAFSSQNIELIMACFREPGMYGSFIDELEKLPPTDVRSRIAKRLLTESWPQDKSPLGLLPPGSAPPPRLELFCLAEITKLIPSANLDPDDPAAVDKLREKRFRISLVQQIETTSTAPQRDLPNGPDSFVGQGKSEKTVHPILNRSPLPLVQPPAPEKAPEAKPTASTPSNEPTSSTPWSIMVALIVAGCGLLWLLLKRRS